MLDASDKPKRTITLAATGASGSLFTREMLRTLEEDERVGCINFLASDSGLRVMAEELGIGRSGLLQQLLGCEPHKTRLLNNQDIGGNIASGSYPTDAMIVLPCSMGTLAKIAQGLASRKREPTSGSRTGRRINSKDNHFKAGTYHCANSCVGSSTIHHSATLVSPAFTK